MDTSPKYILMCEKSPMKEGHEWNMGDWFFDPKGKSCGLYLGSDKLPYSHRIHVFSEGTATISRADIPYRLIPIWRQDQLQEMLGYDLTFPDALQILLGEFCFFGADPVAFGEHEWKKHQAYLNLFKSMEQLLLAFVVHKNYQKQWSEEKGEWMPLPKQFLTGRKVWADHA